MARLDACGVKPFNSFKVLTDKEINPSPEGADATQYLNRCKGVGFLETAYAQAKVLSRRRLHRVGPICKTTFYSSISS
jgi:hypothetical protein